MPYLKFIRNFHKTNTLFERSYNSVTLLGRTGKNLEIRGPAEKPYAVFSLATSSNHKNSSGVWEKKTQWHRVVAFKPQLKDILEKFFKTGHRIHVQGYLNYRDILDNNGNMISHASIVADDIILLYDIYAESFKQSIEKEDNELSIEARE